MDYSTKNVSFGFIGKLAELAETHPIGAASAFCAMHDRLIDVVQRLGSDLSADLVQKIADLRKRIGNSFNDDSYEQTVKELRLQQDTEYFRQRGYVACQLLEGLKPEPFKDENDMTLEQIDWIISSLTEARPAFSLDVRSNAEKDMFIPELREANTLKLALSGFPDEYSECKFLLIQELTLARICDNVPASAMLGYWQALTPKNDAAKAIHATAEEALISLPRQTMSETAYIENGLLMLEALSETVESASKDWQTRILCAQSTEYINGAREDAERRIRCMSNAYADLSCWKERCESIIHQISENFESAKQAEICKHFELGAVELSPYGDNFLATSENAYLALAAVN
jgi:hypothetical protein